MEQMRLVRNLQRLWQKLVGGAVEQEPTKGTDTAESGVDPPAAKVVGQVSPRLGPEIAVVDEEGLVDDLTVIRGIGPARQKRLYAIGIRSYSQLAAAAPEDVRQALSSENQRVKVEQWINQARELVGGGRR